MTIFPLLTGAVTHANIDIPTISDSNTGTAPVTTLLITDLYGNVVGGKLVTIYLYADANCTQKSTLAVISGNNATSNSSGYANFIDLKISTAGSYFVGTTVEGVQSQCGIKPVTITVANKSTSLSIATISGIAVAVGLAVILLLALLMKFNGIWPFKRRNGIRPHVIQIPANRTFGFKLAMPRAPEPQSP